MERILHGWKGKGSGHGDQRLLYGIKLGTFSPSPSPAG